MIAEIMAINDMAEKKRKKLIEKRKPEKRFLEMIPI